MTITIINPCFLKQTKNTSFICSVTENVQQSINYSKSTCNKFYYFSDYESWFQVSIHVTLRGNLSHCICKSDIKTFYGICNDNH